jgi:hypothetical protein
MRLGMSMDSTKIILNPFLYVLHLTIWWLSAVQIYQCISLLMGPLSNGWWVPLICKHGSLIAYVIFLNFISFRHQADILEITKLEKLCSKHYEGLKEHKKITELAI